uniref:Saposin B-type domain-containing protein n=1 Tax=Haptolina brevifila TaxID=156173 RepID=A0A7S2MJG5_9EUKA|mmetsp:Transcript_53428/g.106256  ORF Transcript_53428/g.106256 Transcript_53428/m.106256 type:complete len:232 (+) Transcript_53428:46-741(+)
MIASVIAAAALASPFSNFQVQEKFSLCSPCVQIGSQGINILLNEILNVGVIGGCGKLCSVLPKGAERTVCDIGCSAVGIKTFINLIKKTDLDPIYFCEEIHACPAGRDDAAASVDANAVSPASGPSGGSGTTFAMEVDFTIINATGVGEIRIGISGGTQDVGQSFVNTGFAPGRYSTNVTLTAQDDPSAQPPVQWSPGTYEYTFEVCQGECGSKHPHSKVFGKTTGSFQIV